MLDQLNQKLIQELQNNGRRSYTELKQLKSEDSKIIVLHQLEHLSPY